MNEDIDNDAAPSIVSLGLDGRVDVLSPARLEGWAWQSSIPERRLTVEIVMETMVVAVLAADQYREDLASSGIGDGYHGFGIDGRFDVDTTSVRILNTDTYLPRYFPAPVPETGRHELAEKDDLALIESSGLFDSEFYLSRYSDVALANTDPLQHYYNTGWRENRQPNYYFDPIWYSTLIAGSQKDHHNPLLHYISRGELDDLSPISFFSPRWYRGYFGLEPHESPLLHLLTNVKSGVVSPNELFDVNYYLERNPDIREAGIDPFKHYMEAGHIEGRNPSAVFDTNFYRRRYLNGSLLSNPLSHHISNGSTNVTNPNQETLWSGELRRFTAPGPFFEERPIQFPRAKPKAKVLAYYLPQFHAFPENDNWWGSGFTEWTNVPRGASRFEGHYQPRVPRDLGFYDLLTPGVMRKQIELARSAGIYGFVFYFYWFDGRRLMERPLERFLNDSSLNFPFCLMWANENWTRRWDGFDEDVLIAQDYADHNDSGLIDTWLEHFRDSRYIRIEGRPLIMIYRPGLIPQMREKLVRWRQIITENGERDPIIVMAQGFNDYNPTKYGFDGAVEFPPHKVAADLPNINPSLNILDPNFTGYALAYNDVVIRSVSEPAPDFPLIKTAFPSWDNDARRQGTGMVVHGSTPDEYQAWLSQLLSYAEHNPFFGERIVCINAWNEWAEGAYLEPDVHFGMAYLNATSRAIHGVHRLSSDKLCLVGHDAHQHGAQILLQRLTEVLTTRFGVEVELVILGSGKLLERYKDLARTTVVQQEQQLPHVFSALFHRGFRSALFNTSASAKAVTYASAAGLDVTMLVHELPSIINEKRLAPSIRRALPFIRELIFPARYVQDKFLALFSETSCPTRIRAQGSYATIEFSESKRETVRSGLKIAAGDTLVLGVGFGDLRKGFDVFLNTWRAAQRRGHTTHFAWVGAVESSLEIYLKAEMDLGAASGRFHALPFTTEIDAYFSACDVFFLASREDPFPTVVLEAISVGVPVIAFEGSGGIPELIKEYDAGWVVPMSDPEAVADLTKDIRSKWPNEERHAPNRLVKIAREAFSFANYSFDLIANTIGPLVKVSVVVPNYNYARHLRSRLDTIFEQQYAVFEIIVLDDCSTDDSLAVLLEIAADGGRSFQVERNDVNSGSVFRQWRRAAELATGDFVWIAEADDASLPEFLRSVVEIFTSDPDVALAFSDSLSVDENGKQIYATYRSYYQEGAPGMLLRDRVFSGHEFIRDVLSERNLIMNVSACVWRRSVLCKALEARGDDLASFRVAGDWLLYVTALSYPGVKVAFLSKPLNIHRRHSGSVTMSALSASQHVGEIKKVQTFVRSIVGADAAMEQRQDLYIEKVASYFGDPEIGRRLLEDSDS